MVVPLASFSASSCSFEFRFHAMVFAGFSHVRLLISGLSVINYGSENLIFLYVTASCSSWFYMRAWNFFLGKYLKPIDDWKKWAFRYVAIFLTFYCGISLLQKFYSSDLHPDPFQMKWPAHPRWRSKSKIEFLKCIVRENWTFVVELDDTFSHILSKCFLPVLIWLYFAMDLQSSDLELWIY